MGAIVLPEVDALLIAERGIGKLDFRDEHHLMPGLSLVHEDVLQHHGLALERDLDAELFVEFTLQGGSPGFAKLDLAAERPHALDPAGIVADLGREQAPVPPVQAERDDADVSMGAPCGHGAPLERVLMNDNVGFSWLSGGAAGIMR